MLLQTPHDLFRSWGILYRICRECNMKEIRLDVFDLPVDQTQFDVICITTNGMVKKNGECVMGAGIAKSFRDISREIPLTIGSYIKQYGNRCFRICKWRNAVLCSFPVKHKWNEMADLNLITESCRQIVEMADKFGYTSIALPRPGCGNGKLDWTEVKPIMEMLLDDRFTIVYL